MRQQSADERCVVSTAGEMEYGKKTPHQFSTFHHINFPRASSIQIDTFFIQQQCPAPPCQGGTAPGGTGHLQSHPPAQIAAATATRLLPSPRRTEITIIWNKQLQMQSVSKHCLLSALLGGSKRSLFTHSRRPQADHGADLHGGRNKSNFEAAEGDMLANNLPGEIKGESQRVIFLLWMYFFFPSRPAGCKRSHYSL